MLLQLQLFQMLWMFLCPEPPAAPVAPAALASPLTPALEAAPASPQTAEMMACVSAPPAASTLLLLAWLQVAINCDVTCITKASHCNQQDKLFSRAKIHKYLAPNVTFVA